MDRGQWLLVFHLFGAFLLLSGAVAIQILSMVAVRKERPSDVAFFFNLGRIAEMSINVGAFAALVFGLWLVHYDGYGYGQGWIVAAIVMWVAVAALGGAGGKRYVLARKEAKKLAAAGDQPTRELERLKRDPTARWLSVASGLVAFALLIVMIWKPGAHLG
jgi:uncharacterized membrane protein